MPLNLESFGPGGEGLSGLFMGQQQAQQQQTDELANQKTLADIANTQAITKQRDLTNQSTEALLPDSINSQRLKYQNEAAQSKIDAYNRSAGAMSKMGAMMSALPAAARPAALKQMAAAYGVEDDNPMLSHLMNMDPNQLPDQLDAYSKHLYDQSDAARALTQKNDAELTRTRETNSSQEKIHAGNNAATIKAAQISADSRLQQAELRAELMERLNGNKPIKESTDQAIARLTSDKATNPDQWSPEKQASLESLVRYKMSVPNAGRPDTVGAMGMAPDAASRIEDAVRGVGGGQVAEPTAAPSGANQLKGLVEKAGGAYEPDKYDYRVGPNGSVQRKAKVTLKQ